MCAYLHYVLLRHFKVAVRYTVKWQRGVFLDGQMTIIVLRAAGFCAIATLENNQIHIKPVRAFSIVRVGMTYKFKVTLIVRAIA